MTNYNDGQWYGWNGGECPVHPDTVVEVAIDNGRLDTDAASGWEWADDPMVYYKIIAFRVIKEHIISRANQGPVREVTTVRKEIVPGLYGAVEVGNWSGPDNMVCLGIMQDWSTGSGKEKGLAVMGIDTLTKAISTLTAIRDAMADSSDDV